MITTRLAKVHYNNEKFVTTTLDISMERFFELMSEAAPSVQFLRKYGKNHNWSIKNPTRGWCGQMTRFLRDCKLIPNGFSPYKDNTGDHYYLANKETGEIIDLTIYQMQHGKDNTIEYPLNRANFNPMKRGTTTKDVQTLMELFEKELQCSPLEKQLSKTK